MKWSDGMTEIHIRGLNQTTKAALQELAAQKKLSLNKYIVGQLELIAKDKLTLETLEAVHIQLNYNTHALLRFEQALLELKGGIEDESRETNTSDAQRATNKLY